MYSVKSRWHQICRCAFTCTLQHWFLEFYIGNGSNCHCSYSATVLPCILCSLYQLWPSRLHLWKGGHRTFHVCNKLSACYAYNNLTDTSKPATVLTWNKWTIHFILSQPTFKSTPVAFTGLPVKHANHWAMYYDSTIICLARRGIGHLICYLLWFTSFAWPEGVEGIKSVNLSVFTLWHMHGQEG